MSETAHSRPHGGPATLTKLNLRTTCRRHGKERGAFAIMSVPAMFVMIGMCGLALDLGMIYNRQVELHGLARTAALAAARELNGTAAGIDNAVAQAAEAAGHVRYAYGRTVPWSAAAIGFSDSPSPNTTWLSVEEAKARPADKFYVRVDTSPLAQELGTVRPIVMPVLTGSTTPVSLAEVAVAGRSVINVLPLAICAMSPVAAAPRDLASGPQELIEYGFRRGVTYDLMNLNPNGATPANFVVDPVSPPGGLGASANTSVTTVSPFICSGKMWIPRVTGGPIRVTSPFPLASLYRQLNSRFDDFSGDVCNPYGAPPDFNVKAYVFNNANGIPWMNPKPAGAAAASHSESNRLHTIADPAVVPSGTSAGMYGPLWAYARAVKYSAYQSGVAEPSGGYSAFTPTDWAKLYPPGPTAASYPSKPPYFATLGANYTAASTSHLPISASGRRVLNVPLLSCPVAPGVNVGASAVAVGKFFMTVPATSSSVYGEFAGIAHESTISGEVILYK